MNTTSKNAYTLTGTITDCHALIKAGMFDQAMTSAKRAVTSFEVGYFHLGLSAQDFADYQTLTDWIASCTLRCGGSIEAALHWAERGRMRALPAAWQEDPDAAGDLSLWEMQEGIPENGVAVYVFPDPSGTTILLLRRSKDPDVMWLKLTSDELADWFEGCGGQDGYREVYAAYVRESFSHSGIRGRHRFEKAYASILGKIWASLMAPVDARLGEIGVKKFSDVVVFTAGPLNLIPVGWAGPNLDTDDAGAPFGANWNVSHMCSLRLLNRQARARNCCETQPASILALLDPTADNQYSLPGAITDGEVLKSIFPLERRELYPNDLATKAAFCNNLGLHSLVLLAMHNWVDWSYPEGSRLYFAGNEVLTIKEASRGPSFNRAHVMMSVCDGANSTHPHGLVSFPYAFVARGAASVMAPHVPIRDDTSPILTNFYLEELLTPDGRIKCRPANALRLACLRLRSITIGELQGIFEPARDPAGRAVPYSIDCARRRRFIGPPSPSTSSFDPVCLAEPPTRTARSRVNGPRQIAEAKRHHQEFIKEKHASLSWLKAVRKSCPGAIVFNPPPDEGMDHKPLSHPIDWACFSVMGV